MRFAAFLTDRRDRLLGGLAGLLLGTGAAGSSAKQPCSYGTDPREEPAAEHGFEDWLIGETLAKPAELAGVYGS